MHRSTTRPPEPTGPVEDDRLRLIFTCCHPALAPENRVALTLRLLGGLTVAEIAAAFLVPETTMAQRITRAKQKIKAAQHPLPGPARGGPARTSRRRAGGALPDLQRGLPRLRAGEALRADLSAEAIRLTRQLREMLTLVRAGTAARGRRAAGADAAHRGSRATRGSRDGVLVTLDDQDRTRWDAAMIDEGHALVRRCLAANRPGPYQLQAAINAVHTDALDASMTDWRRSSSSTTSCSRFTVSRWSR